MFAYRPGRSGSVHIMNADSSIAGTQVVGRITSLLRAVSQGMPAGKTTSELARLTSLARPTAHRLLVSLGEQGFVDRDSDSSRWFLGPEMYLLGHAAADRYDITDIARPHVVALAEATGESAFLSARRGMESVCLLRHDGSFPIRSFVLYEGKRFPLGVASAGIAMLAFMPEEVVQQHLARESFVPEHGASHAPEVLVQRLRDTRQDGYSTNPGLIVEGSWGMGAAVFDSSGSPAWALSLTGIESRFTPERRPELGRLLLEHAHKLSRELQRPAHSALRAHVSTSGRM